MITKGTSKQLTKMRDNGSVLVLAAFVVFILTILGFGLLTASYGARLRAARSRNETMAKLTAEAGYEEAISWMNQQADVLSVMTTSSGISTRKIKGTSSLIQFPNSNFQYTISFDRFWGNHPVYRVISEGACGQFSRTVEALVVQAISGWDMGLCEIPTGTSRSSKTLAPFKGEDILDIPIHINSNGAPTDQFPDMRIHWLDKPQFKRRVSMGESRYMWWGTDRDRDKYRRLIDLFEEGIYFDQPANRVTNRLSTSASTTVMQKVDRFERNTSPTFSFSRGKNPVVSNYVTLPDATWSQAPAVQLEFYVQDGVGMVKITNNCTVCCTQGYRYDYMLAIGASSPYMKYPIYGYHYADPTAALSYPIATTYVTQRAGTSSGKVAKTNPGGQIFVDGNVIIGGATNIDANGNVFVAGTMFPSKVQGRLTVVATGNIWIVSPVEYTGLQDVGYEGAFLVKKVPDASNENVLGLFSQFGVVKVVDPGLSVNVPRDSSNPNIATVYNTPGGAELHYRPIGYQKTTLPSFVWDRQLPQSMVVQAAITACGGGWGAENIGARTNTNQTGKDVLIVTGSIVESVQGIVAYGDNGFRRCYYFDGRLLDGILPGDMWLQSKYVPVPGGWKDSRG